MVDGNIDEVESEPLSRRAILRNSAGTGLGIVALSGLTSSVAAAEESVDVTTLESGERGRVLSSALSDPVVKRLRSRFVENGWAPEIHRARVVRTEDHDRSIEYHTVQIPFDVGTEGEQAHLLWSDSDVVETQGRYYVHVADRTWRETSYWVEGESVRSDSAERSVDIPEPDDVSAQAWCAPWNIHWGCVLVIAGAFATTYGSCAICVGDPTRYTCLVCIGAVLGGTGGIAMCTWCG